MTAFVDRHFYYTINAWEKVSTNADWVNSAKNAEDAHLPEAGYVKFTSSSKSVSIKNEVVYRIALYEKVLAGQPDPWNNNTIAAADVVHGPLEIESNGAMMPSLQSTDKFNIWKTKVEADGIATIVGVNYLWGTAVGYTRIVDEKFIEWTVVPKKAGTITPEFKMQFNPNTGVNDTPNYQTIAIKPGMVIPTTNFTKAKTTPPVPDSVKNNLWDGPTLISGGSSSWYEWNACTSRWLKYVRKEQTYVTVPATSTAMSYSYHKYQVWILYYDKNGTEITPGLNLGWEINKNHKVYTSTSPKSPVIPYVNAAGSPTKRASDELRNAKACNSVPADTGDLPSAKPVYPIDDNEKVNPPSHFMTRGIPLTQRSNMNTKGAFIGNEKAVDFQSSRNNLGMIFQDADTINALNDASDKKPYGFRFVYNPTTIQYATAMNTQIDWLLSSNDPANVIGGNTQVNFTLYLNRIADMTELKALYEKPGTYSANYPRTLTEREIQGILHRGTEYDIEFLYRCVNGTPKPSDNGLLTYKTQDGAALTSDFGYITGTPVWIKLHNNMRFKGSLSSISVNHVMFSLDMVPILTTVDISFIRYPVFGDIPDKQTAAYKDAATKLKTGGGTVGSGDGTTS